MCVCVCEQLPGANSSPIVTKLRQSYPWSQGKRGDYISEGQRSRSVGEVCALLSHSSSRCPVVWVLSDLSDMRCRRRLIVYPLKMSELSHPTLMEAVGLSTEFRTSYMKSRVGGSVDTMTWVG